MDHAALADALRWVPTRNPLLLGRLPALVIESLGVVQASSSEEARERTAAGAHPSAPESPRPSASAFLLGRAADGRTLICIDRALVDDVFDKAHETVVTEVDDDDD